MKAVVKTKSGVGNVELREMPKPEVGKGQVLIEVKAAGLCGTDVHIFYDEFKSSPPVILGHEVSGSVAGVGKGVTNVRIGERVTTESYFETCGVCYYCRNGKENLCLNRLSIGSRVNGGMAKYVVVPARNIHKLPKNISYVEGAMTEPLACVIHSTLDLTKIAPGDVVVVSGPGPIGLLTAQVAKQAGAVVIVIGLRRDIDRLRVAEELGADHTVNLEKKNVIELINDLSGGRGADVVFECAGVEASVEMCLRLIRRVGQYTQIGLVGQKVSFDIDQIIYKEVIVRGGNASVSSAWPRALKLMEIEKIKLRPLISHVLPISQWEKAFEMFKEKSGSKILLTPC
jgi:L-iditol 2-dehydrogenase